jgi:small subunit ribosomal protein S13
MRIAGITLDDNKRIEIALTAIYGIGRSKAQRILTEAKVDFGRKPGDLSADEENLVRKMVESMTIEGELRREIGSNIKRLRDIKSYRGSRHSRGLPARGQRTRTNGRTKRGKRVTMGSGKKKVEKK